MPSRSSQRHAFCRSTPITLLFLLFPLLRSSFNFFRPCYTPNHTPTLPLSPDTPTVALQPPRLTTPLSCHAFYKSSPITKPVVPHALPFPHDLLSAHATSLRRSTYPVSMHPPHALSSAYVTFPHPLTALCISKMSHGISNALYTYARPDGA